MNTLTLIGITVVAAYYMGHLAKKIKLPSLIGYMILGVILGRSGLDYFNIDLVEELGFINEIALGFVAFSIGIELSISSLKKQGIGIISIILVESFAAFFVVLGAVYLLTKDLPMSLIFAAMAPASAPAGTVAGPVWSFSTIGPVTPVDIPDLVAMYPLNEDASSLGALDVSGNDNHGALIGDLAFVDDPDMGQVLSLPGGDDQYVALGAVGISGNMPKTITMSLSPTSPNLAAAPLRQIVLLPAGPAIAYVSNLAPLSIFATSSFSHWAMPASFMISSSMVRLPV